MSYPREPAFHDDARIGVVDVETTPIKAGRIPRTKFWGLAIEDWGYTRFKTAHELLKFLAENPKLRLYYHHDYEICQLLVEGVTPHSMRARGSRIIRASVGGTQWINSFALFPSKLDEILEAGGFKKLPLNYGDHPVNCSCELCWKALEERNYSDCSEALIAFRKISNAYFRATGIDPINDGMATSAACSFAAAEAVAGPLPVYLRERQCYRGGRTEAPRLGDCGETEAWDINSSYPFAFIDAPKKDRMIEAEVEIDTRYVSPFFRHAPHDKEFPFLFPEGIYTTYFFESNYERYIRPHAYGVVKNIRPIRSVDVDLSWINNVAPNMKRAFALRKIAKEQGDEPLSFGLKINMNACYGRVGMKAEREISSIKDRIPKDGAYYELPDSRYLVFQKHYLGTTKANYLLAGWITDNARARLYAGLAQSHAYYCDTDSVYCRPGTFREPNVGKELGAWKYLKKAPMHITTVKDYTFGDETKLKGGSGYTRWTVKSALPNPKTGLVSGVVDVPKERKTEYNKREVYADGSTRPLIVYE